MNKNARTATCLLVLALLTPGALAQQGGGNVSNVPPTTTSGLTGDVGVVTNIGEHVETFSFTIQDTNGEDDLVSVRIVSDDTTFGTQTCSDITPATTCPDWTFTDSTPDDGIISGTFTYTWPAGQAAGTYTQTFSAKDETAYTSAGASTDQTQFTADADVTIESGVYDINGDPIAGNWGGWTAAPGDTNVDSVTFLKASNAGTATGQVTVSWTGTTFTDGTDTIAIDGNLAFSTGTGASPSAGMTPGSVDADGTASFTIAAGATLWIGYRISAIPTPAPDVTYTASYTFTDTS